MQYDFEMASDESHARVMVGSRCVGTIQNNPKPFDGLNFGQNSGEHGSPLFQTDDSMWDQFFDWTERL